MMDMGSHLITHSHVVPSGRAGPEEEGLVLRAVLRAAAKRTKANICGRRSAFARAADHRHAPPAPSTQTSRPRCPPTGGLLLRRVPRLRLRRSPARSPAAYTRQGAAPAWGLHSASAYMASQGEGVGGLASQDLPSMLNLPNSQETGAWSLPGLGLLAGGSQDAGLGLPPFSQGFFPGDSQFDGLTGAVGGQSAAATHGFMQPSERSMAASVADQQPGGGGGGGSTSTLLGFAQQLAGVQQGGLALAYDASGKALPAWAQPKHPSLLKPEHKNSRANRRGPMDEMRCAARRGRSFNLSLRPKGRPPTGLLCACAIICKRLHPASPSLLRLLPGAALA